MNCPITSKKCSGNECIGFCSFLRKKLYKGEPPIKKCPLCNEYLVPFGEVFLHSPKSKCKYAEMVGVTIEVTRDDYEKALGKPTATYNDQIVYLITEPKSLLRRALNAFKQRLSMLKQRKQSQNQPEKP